MMNRRLFAMVCLLLSAAGALAAGHWTVNPYAFRYDMTVYAVLQVNGRTLTDYTDYEVAAFCGDECRGVAKVQTATNGTLYLYLRIRSNEVQGETISVKVYDSKANSEKYLSESISFESESVVCTPSEPMVLTYSAIKMGDVNGDGEVNEVDAQLILDLSVGQISLSDLAVPTAVSVPGGNDDAYEVNAQIVLDYSVAAVKPW